MNVVSRPDWSMVDPPFFLVVMQSEHLGISILLLCCSLLVYVPTASWVFGGGLPRSDEPAGEDIIERNDVLDRGHTH